MSKKRQQRKQTQSSGTNAPLNTFQAWRSGAADLAEGIAKRIPKKTLGFASCFAGGIALGVGASYLARRARMEGSRGASFGEEQEGRPVIDVMTEFPVVCTAETPLAQVARRMVETDCGAIPVVDAEGSRRPIGIITDRDIVVRALAENRNPLSLVAGDCMTALTVTIPDTASVFESVDLMREHGIRRIVVVDENGDCVGIVAQADIALELSPSQTQELVGEVSAATGTTRGPVAA